MIVTDEVSGVKYSIGFANGDWQRDIIAFRVRAQRC